MNRTFSFIKAHRVFFEAALIGIVALVLRVVNLENWPRWEGGGNSQANATSAGDLP